MAKYDIWMHGPNNKKILVARSVEYSEAIQVCLQANNSNKSVRTEWVSILLPEGMVIND